MFRHKTVVVIGAGASKECDLPTGEELKGQIASLVDIRFKYGRDLENGDWRIVEALRLLVRNTPSRDITPYVHAGRRIRSGLTQSISIDNFLDLHQGNEHIETCGKLAIVRSILEGERNSLLYFDPQGSIRHPDFEALDKTWYNSFIKLLTQGCPLKDLPTRLSKLAFVVFNYDRCLEHFLYYSLQNVYGISDEEAGAMLKNTTILHPYGVVGHLPWQGKNQTIAYGAEPHPQDLVNLATGIKTFTEGTDPSASDITHIRSQIAEASVLLFLGFAYHSQNLALLQPSGNHADPVTVRYYGSAFHMSKSDRDSVVTDLSKLGAARTENINICEKTCSEMFQEYWRSLSLG